MHSAGDVVMCFDDFNGHIGRHIDGFHWVLVWYGVGWTNLVGSMLLEFCLEKELIVCNAWFMREEKRKVTLRTGENETGIDFVLMNKWFM